MECPNCKRATEEIDDYILSIRTWHTAEQQRNYQFVLAELARIKKILRPSKCKTTYQKKSDKEELIKRGVIRY